jgi:hypothetical protein
VENKKSRNFSMLLVFLVSLGMSMPAFAQGMWTQDEELGKLHEQIGAHLLFRTLDLSAEQKPQIKTRLEKIRATINQIKQEQAKANGLLKSRMQSALILLERGETPQLDTLEPSMDIMIELRNEIHKLRNNLRDQFTDLLDLLTPEQQQKLRDFHPMAMMGGGLMKDFGCSGNAGDLLDQVRFAPAPFIVHMDRRIRHRSIQMESNGETEKAKALIDFWSAILGVRKLEESIYRQKRASLSLALNGELVAEMNKLCMRHPRRHDNLGDSGFGPDSDSGRGIGHGFRHGRSGHGMDPGGPVGDMGQDIPGMPSDLGMGEDTHDPGSGYGWKKEGRAHFKMVQQLMVSDTFMELLSK